MSTLDFNLEKEMWRFQSVDDYMLEILTYLENYIDAPRHTLSTLGLWAIASHFAPDLPLFPYLIISAPSHGQGKSVTGGLLAKFCPQPVFHSSSTTASALFNTVDDQKGRLTLVVDEADEVLKDKEIAPILNGGHSKETAKVFRNVGKKTIAFNTYCPKIITGIQADNLLKTLTSRSIVIRLAPAKRKIASRIDDLVLGKIKEDEFSSVATNLKIWSETNKENFKTAYVKAIDFFEKENQSRNLDNWKPIFAIAFMSNLGKNRAHVLVDSALKTMNEQSNSSPISDELDLLFKVKNAIENEDERILIANLHSKINPENFESELKTISKNNVMSKNRFAKFLNGYGIHCRRSKSERYYLKADFIEAFDKYLKDYIPL